MEWLHLVIQQDIPDEPDIGAQNQCEFPEKSRKPVMAMRRHPRTDQNQTGKPTQKRQQCVAAKWSNLPGGHPHQNVSPDEHERNQSKCAQ